MKNEQSLEYVGKKRKDSSIESGNLGNKKQINPKENVILMEYTLDKTLFEYGKRIKLFGEDFVRKNENKCKIIIAGKEYDIISGINLEDFKKYGINEEDENLEIIF